MHKESGIPFLSSALQYIGNNLLTSHIVNKTDFVAKNLALDFKEGLTGQAHRGKIGNAIYGAAAGYLPEINILKNNAVEAGAKLKEQGHNVANLDVGKSLEAFSNNLSSAYKNFHENVPQNIKDNIQQFADSKVSSELKQDAGKIVNSNNLLSRFAKNVAKPIEPVVGDLATNNKIYQGAKVTSLAGLAALDPISGAYNAGKLVIDSKPLQKFKPVKAVSNFLNEKVLVKPLKESFEKGKTDTFKPTPIKDFVAKALFNPITTDMKSYVADMGNIYKKHNQS